MSSNADEPRFGPAPRQIDEHLIETFGKCIPEEVPACYGDFDVRCQRTRGCHQCHAYDRCRAWSELNKPPTAENRRKLGYGSDPLADSSEQDPNGLNPHAPGAKLDAGKTRLWLVFSGFANALEAVGTVGTYGAKKYSGNGWRSVPDGEARYTDALLRHLLAEPREAFDEESGLLHAAHAAWNSLARLELMLRTAPHGTTPDSDSSVR
jgi:hypothetical protein